MDEVERIGRTPDAVIPILQAMQDHYGYLPEEVLRRICATTQITPAAISGVSTFYDMFRHEPVGKYIVHVCHGTACHVGGAERVEDALRRHLRIPEGTSTDANRQFTIESSLAWAAALWPRWCASRRDRWLRHGRQSAGHDPRLPGSSPGRLAAKQPSRATRHASPGGAEIKVCLDSCCVAKGTDRVFHALEESVIASGAKATVKRVGCVGACYRTPMIEVSTPGRPNLTYTGLTVAEAGNLVQAHFRPPGLVRRISRLWTQAMDGLLLDDGASVAPPPSAAGARSRRGKGNSSVGRSISPWSTMGGSIRWTWMSISPTTALWR